MDFVSLLLAIIIVILVGAACLFLNGIFAITKLLAGGAGFFVLLIIACLLFAYVEKTKTKNKKNEKK